MTRKYYCANVCPDRFDSECFVGCHLDIEEREQEDRDNREVDEDDIEDEDLDNDYYGKGDINLS